MSTEQSEPQQSVARDIFQRRISGIAEEMSAALRRSAFSSIIWEMYDYSCALFTPEGKMVAQAQTIAAQLGIDARPLVVAVMVAASASFATPIGYQTNMLVYGAGGYRFTDFLKVGIPLNLSIGVLASLCIPWFWPLYPA